MQFLLLALPVASVHSSQLWKLFGEKGKGEKGIIKQTEWVCFSRCFFLVQKLHFLDLSSLFICVGCSSLCVVTICSSQWNIPTNYREVARYDSRGLIFETRFVLPPQGSLKFATKEESNYGASCGLVLFPQIFRICSGQLIRWQCLAYQGLVKSKLLRSLSTSSGVQKHLRSEAQKLSSCDHCIFPKLANQAGSLSGCWTQSRNFDLDTYLCSSISECKNKHNTCGWIKKLNWIFNRLTTPKSLTCEALGLISAHKNKSFVLFPGGWHTFLLLEKNTRIVCRIATQGWTWNTERHCAQLQIVRHLGFGRWTTRITTCRLSAVMCRNCQLSGPWSTCTTSIQLTEQRQTVPQNELQFPAANWGSNKRVCLCQLLLVSLRKRT